jgi:hypothetical protein
MSSSQPEFLACNDCGIAAPLTCTSVGQPDDEFEAAPRDALEEFIASHQSHRTAQLCRHGSECQSDRPLWDPMATVTFAATDGERTYLVTATRASIDAPRQYRIQPGRLVVQQSEVLINTADLRLGLDLQMFPHVLPPTKLDRFVAAVHDVLRTIDAEDVEVVCDDVDDPAASIARMPDTAYAQVVARCEEIFSSWEMQLVTTFLQDNREADGLLALYVRRRVTAVPA